MGFPLLITKIRPPRLRSGIVERSDLVDKIRSGLEKEKKLVLISAPAGYGKSTVLGEVVETTETPVAWLSLDVNDNDPSRFVAYVVAALKTVDERYGDATASLLSTPELLPADVLLSPLINELCETGKEIVLILDDYHVIKNRLVDEAVTFLIANAPDSLRVIISTRQDPTFPLSRYRVMDTLIEVRADNLRFTSEEALEFFGKTMGLPVRPEMAVSLDRITEGWVAGLQLAAISMKSLSENQRSKFMEGFSGTSRYIIDYLVEETMKNLPEEVSNFLKKTSVLDRFCPELCNSVLNIANSDGVLDKLEKQNLFLIPLDDERKWFRYHHLFAEFLRSWLDKDARKVLNAAASEWFENQGLYSEAIEYAFAADAVSRAAELLNTNAGTFFSSGEVNHFLSEISRLSEEALAGNIHLLIYRAWGLFITGDIPGALKTVDFMSEYHLNVIEREDLGRLKALQSWLLLMSGAPAEEQVREALNLLGPENDFFRAVTLICLGEVLRRRNNLGDSSGIFWAASDLAGKSGNTFVELVGVMEFAFNKIIESRFKEAATVCEAAIARYSTHEGVPLPITGIVYIPLGISYYAMNELGPAAELLEKGVELGRRLRLDRVLGGDAERTLALIYYIRGDRERAFSLIEEYDSRIDREGMAEVHDRNRALLYGLKLRDNLTDEVAAWARSVERRLEATGTTIKETEFSTYINFILKDGQNRRALDVIDGFEKSIEGSDRLSTRISVLVTRTIALERLGKRVEALVSLTEAVIAAANSNFKRLLLDYYDRVGHLLREVRHIAPEFVDDLLKNVRPHIPSTKALTELAEVLTEREMEILTLISAGASNQEISDRLFITLGTTKWHITNILGKLGVRNRTLAVVKARQLSIIH